MYASGACCAGGLLKLLGEMHAQQGCPSCSDCRNLLSTVMHADGSQLPWRWIVSSWKVAALRTVATSDEGWEMVHGWCRMLAGLRLCLLGRPLERSTGAGAVVQLWTGMAAVAVERIRLEPVEEARLCIRMCLYWAWRVMSWARHRACAHLLGTHQDSHHRNPWSSPAPHSVMVHGRRTGPLPSPVPMPCTPVTIICLSPATIPCLSPVTIPFPSVTMLSPVPIFCTPVTTRALSTAMVRGGGARSCSSSRHFGKGRERIAADRNGLLAVVQVLVCPIGEKGVGRCLCAHNTYKYIDTKKISE
jgi:hypothetical protein